MKIFITILFCVSLSSCGIVHKTARQGMVDGFYTQNINKNRQRVYVSVIDESINIYQVVKAENIWKADTGKNVETYLPRLPKPENIRFSLSKESFDFDFLSIPLKYRFHQQDIQPQLNTNLNGAAYFGYRTDKYTINYALNPLHIAKMETVHFGYSIGLFTGFGNTFMSPTNTRNVLQQEYDGIVWGKGVAGILGVNNFTIGLSVGFDNLLDQNGDIWIYENKPWLGLAFGLNLN